MNFFLHSRKAGPYDHLLRLLVIGLLLLSGSRLLLVTWLYDRIAATDSLGMILLQGIRADLILLGLLLALPVLLALLWPRLHPRSWFTFTYYWSLGALVFIIFLELSTPSFILQYDIRPNRLYIEYLKYPKEVFSTLWHGFRVPLLLGLALTGISVLVLRKLLRIPQHQDQAWSWPKHLLVWPLVVLAVAAGIRSTTQHRPANPALFAITSDAMVNSLVINSGYSVLFALYNLKHEARSTEMYGKLSEDEVLQAVRAWPWQRQYQFTNAELPTLHWQQAHYQPEKPLNIVIVLQESLGSTYVESLGGHPVTPSLEQLKNEGIWFENLYATGTRSVRGIEAVVAGFMPTPAQSVVKLSASQRNFATLGTVLQAQGYHTQFIYGGEAHFDNMRSFFTGNGIEDIVDLNNMPDAQFIGSWGASDEDLFNTAHQQLTQLHQQGQPFFSLIFTSSNHSPYEFPDGRIELHEQPKETVLNAVKYADWAMGEFFRKAKASPYWQDTLFLVVADHDSRVYGSNLIPVERFRIPGLILGGKVTPGAIKPLASQIDLAPTLLSMAGVSSCHPMIGRDFTADAVSPGRAMMQYNDVFALMTEQELTILRPDGTPLTAHYDRQQQRLVIDPQATPQTDFTRALAHVQLPSYLYREQKYQIPDQAPAARQCQPIAALITSKE